MAERRMLSKTISTSLKVNRLPDRAALLYTWLIPHSDDFGHLEGSPISIRAKVAPMRQYTDQEVQQDLELMVQNNLIGFYEVKGERYIEILNFDSFQTFRSDRPRRAEYPAPDGSFPSDNQLDTDDTPEGDIAPRKGSKGKGSKGKGREGNIYTDEFEKFWKIYPKKVGKPKTFEFWKKLTAEEKKAIIDDIPKRKSDDKWVNGFVKDPERYIKNRQWEDEIIQPRGSTRQLPANDKYSKKGL